MQVVLGSDVVYSEAAVELLCPLVAALLVPGGLFLHVASEDRLGTEALPASMEAAGLSLEADERSPEALLAAPATTTAARRCRPLAECTCVRHEHSVEEETCAETLRELRTRMHIVQRYRKRGE